MSTKDVEAHGLDGIGLAAAIEMIRSDLLTARASGEKSEVRFPVDSVTVELVVIAATDVRGEAGFKVPLVSLELGGSASRQWEQTSKVTVVFGPPVDDEDQQVKVADTSNEVDG